MSEATVQAAEAAVGEAKQLNQQVTQSLISTSEVELQPAAGSSVVAAAKAPENPPTERPVTSAKDDYIAKEDDVKLYCCQTSARDWGIIVCCFLTLYACLAGYYAGLITIAVTVREGGEYKSLPQEFYGSFDRNYYFSGLGARRSTQEVIYPWQYYANGCEKFNIATDAAALENTDYTISSKELQKWDAENIFPYGTYPYVCAKGCDGEGMVTLQIQNRYKDGKDPQCVSLEDFYKGCKSTCENK